MVGYFSPQAGRRSWWRRASVIRGVGTVGKRSVKEVPFVELARGRVQGVVSSGSDPARVYVAYLEGGTGNYYCATNNNRPCGGLRGSPCKHIAEMVGEAILEHGPERVAAYLGVASDGVAFDDARAILGALRGREKKEAAGDLFSRFLDYPDLLRAGSTTGDDFGNGVVHLMNVAALAPLPDGLDEALGLVDGLDQALMHGFARLDDERRARLDGLAATFAGTPLGPAVVEAVAAVGRSEFLPRSFLGLSSARVAPARGRARRPRRPGPPGPGQAPRRPGPGAPRSTAGRLGPGARQRAALG